MVDNDAEIKRLDDCIVFSLVEFVRGKSDVIPVLLSCICSRRDNLLPSIFHVLFAN